MSKISERKLFIGKITRDITASDLENEFEKFGKISNVVVKGNYGFIEFENTSDAEEAQEEMDGKKVMGCRIVVEFAGGSKKNGNYKGPSTKDVCFNCGKTGHWANECREGSWK